MAARTERNRKLICRGAHVDVVAAVRGDGSCPLMEFLDQIEKSDRAKLHAIFERFANHGDPHNGRKYKRLEGDVWEFKTRVRDTGLRVTCYRTERLLVLLTGFTKKEDEADPGDVRRAVSLMSEDKCLHSGGASKGRR